MTGQSAEAKRVVDDGAWRVLYVAVRRERHVDAAHRHVLCTPDVIFTSWSSWRPPSETHNGPHRPVSIPGRVASNRSSRSRCRCYRTASTNIHHSIRCGLPQRLVN